jgi:hypothetical protein
VEKAKEYIRAGDAFQIVPSQRFFAEIGDLGPFLLYRACAPSPLAVHDVPEARRPCACRRLARASGARRGPAA